MNRSNYFKWTIILGLISLGLFSLGLFPLLVACSGQKTSDSGQTEPVLTSVSDSTEYKVTFIELGSVRCIPCKKMMPIMEAIETQYGDQVKVVFHDVWTDEGKPFAEQYGIKLIPTQIFLDKDGAEYFRHEGFFPQDELIAVLKQKGVE